MDKQKIVSAAREKVRGENPPATGGQKSLLGDVLNTVLDIVGEASNSSENQPVREDSKGGKVSGRKPQSVGRAASVGRSVADQLKGKK